MQPRLQGEAYKSRDTRVDLQTEDKELWKRPWNLSFYSLSRDTSSRIGWLSLAGDLSNQDSAPVVADWSVAVVEEEEAQHRRDNARGGGRPRYNAGGQHGRGGRPPHPGQWGIQASAHV